MIITLQLRQLVWLYMLYNAKNTPCLHICAMLRLMLHLPPVPCLPLSLPSFSRSFPSLSLFLFPSRALDRCEIC